MKEPDFDSEFILYLEHINDKYGFDIKERLRIEIKKMQSSKENLLSDHIVLLKHTYKIEKELERLKKEPSK